MKHLSSGDALGLLRRCLREGEVILTRHFRQRLRERGLTLPQVQHVMRTGSVLRPAEFDGGRRQWKYSVEGRDFDGLWLCVVFRFEETDKALLITVFDVEELSR